LYNDKQIGYSHSKKTLARRQPSPIEHGESVKPGEKFSRENIIVEAQ